MTFTTFTHHHVSDYYTTQGLTHSRFSLRFVPTAFTDFATCDAFDHSTLLPHHGALPIFESLPVAVLRCTLLRCSGRTFYGTLFPLISHTLRSFVVVTFEPRCLFSLLLRSGRSGCYVRFSRCLLFDLLIRSFTHRIYHILHIRLRLIYHTLRSRPALLFCYSPPHGVTTFTHRTTPRFITGPVTVVTFVLTPPFPFHYVPDLRLHYHSHVLFHWVDGCVTVVRYVVTLV